MEEEAESIHKVYTEYTHLLIDIEATDRLSVDHRTQHRIPHMRPRMQ